MPSAVVFRKDTPRHMPPRPDLHPHPVPPPPQPQTGEEPWRKEPDRPRPHDWPESPPAPERPER